MLPIGRIEVRMTIQQTWAAIMISMRTMRVVRRMMMKLNDKPIIQAAQQHTITALTKLY